MSATAKQRFVCGECGERFERGGYCSRDGKPIAETEDPLVGSEIGRYRVARMLAEGGMGRVYMGVQPAIGSRVAIKVLMDAAGSSADLVERFFAEARAVNLIRHENIVSVIDMAKLDDGRPYIVMEYIEGQTLASLVRAGGAPLGGVVQVMLEVLSALAAAHAIGIVHRDLKPDNILVTGEGHAKVVDFGIAKLMPGLSQQLSPRTRTGALLGTPAYMAPEQISGSGQIDPRADIYAAGVVLYEAVTGRVPFVGETLFDLMRQHLEVPPAPPRTLRPDLPEPLEQVILQALAKQPAQRFQSAAAMAQATQHAAAAIPTDQWRSLSSRGSGVIAGGRASTAHIQSPPKSPTTTASPTPHHDSQRPTRPTPAAPAGDRARSKRAAWIAAIVGTAAVAIGVTWFAATRGTSTPSSSSPSSTSTSTSTPPTSTSPTSTSTSTSPTSTTSTSPTSTSTSTSPTSTSPTSPPSSPSPSSPSPTSPPSSTRTSKAPPATTTTSPAGGTPPTTTTTSPPAPAGGLKQLTVAADYNPKSFDPIAYLPTATALARKLYPDAKLTRFDFEPVFFDGRVDLTMPGDDRDFWFRSEAASKRPANVPANMPVDRPCMVYVELTARSVTARIVENDECNAPFVRTPRCRLGAVWQKALDKHGAAKDHVAKIGWLFDEKWFFDSDLANDDSGVTTSVEDRCP